MLENLVRAKAWIVTLMLGIAVIMFGVRGMAENRRPAIDISDPGFEWSDIEVGDHIVMDIDIVFPPFAQATDRGAVKGKYFALPRIVQEDSLFSVDDFIGIYVRNDSGKLKEYEDLSSACVAWWTSDTQELSAGTIHVDGIVKEMNKEFPGYFRDYMSDIGFDDTFIDGTHYDLAIYPVEKNGMILIVIGAALTISGIAGIAFKMRRR